MRKTLLFLLGSIAFSASAQVLNPGFETWNGNNPGNWRHSNSGNIINCQQSSDAHSGNSAIQLKAIQNFLIVNGRINQRVIPSATPLKIDFWYKGGLIFPTGLPNSDMAYCLALIYFGGSTIPEGDTLKLFSSDNGNSYSQKTLNLNTAPFGSSVVDSIQIHFQLRDFSGSLTNADLNSTFRVDDVVLTVANPNGEEQIYLGEPELMVYPNPIVDGIIRFEAGVGEEGPIEVRVMDLQGRVVLTETLAGRSGEQAPYSVNANGLAAGNYLINIRQSGFEANKQITIK